MTLHNELLWFLALLMDFGILLGFYRCLGRLGVLIWIPMATILANIQVLKTVELFGMTATLGNVAYGSIFLATDILSENYSKKDAVLAVKLGFFAMFVSIALMSLSLAFLPAPDDFAHESFKNIFSVMPRVALASVIAYCCSQSYDVLSYHFLKKHFPGTKYLWLRNNLSTIISQLLDTLIFTTIAFLGTYPKEVFWSIAYTTFFLKAFTALLDTPCIYYAKRLFQNKKIKEFL